jgi:hypothetical protein
MELHDPSPQSQDPVIYCFTGPNVAQTALAGQLSSVNRPPKQRSGVRLLATKANPRTIDGKYGDFI